MLAHHWIRPTGSLAYYLILRICAAYGLVNRVLGAFKPFLPIIDGPPHPEGLAQISRGLHPKARGGLPRRRRPPHSKPQRLQRSSASRFERRGSATRSPWFVRTEASGPSRAIAITFERIFAEWLDTPLIELGNDPAKVAAKHDAITEEMHSIPGVNAGYITRHKLLKDHLRAQQQGREHNDLQRARGGCHQGREAPCLARCGSHRPAGRRQMPRHAQRYSLSFR